MPSASRESAIDTTPIGRREAARIEAAEARAWADLYGAAPPDWAAAAGLRTRMVGETLVLHWAATARRYFSRTLGLGVAEAATEDALDEIVDGFERDGITMFLLQSLPHCEPAGYGGWLAARGLEPFDRQDRIVRDGRPATAPATSGRGIEVERVTETVADEWAAFLQAVYRLDTGPWLQRLIGRPGWHQYVAREAGAVVAARGMFIGPDGLAWLGMEGPVPGIATDDYEPDAMLCARIVADGLAVGARGFLADIEAPSEALDTPAYATFARLGFSRPYVRTHHARR
jgi:hypothetical protein